MSDTKEMLIKKHLIRPFLNGGTNATPQWVQIGYATEFTRAMNPVTEERDYIKDEHPTTEITDYKPSEALSITTYKNSPDFELLYRLYKERAVGKDAQRQFLLVSLFDKTEVGGKTYYYADLTDCTVVIDEFNTSGSTISATIYENGTNKKGYIEIVDGEPSFTEGDFPTA